jgi:CDP-glucose 4,6-dehydratase
MFQSFYRQKTVLVTGQSGFKGSWLSLWLKKAGARVYGLGLPAPTNPSLHEVIREYAFDGETECDIRDLKPVKSAVMKTAPDLVFHLAAQPLVRLSYSNPLETLQTNAIGSANLLEAVRAAERPCPVIVITSDKCYENKEWDFAYRENDPLGGHDVYSMSKAATELVAQSWNKSFFQPNPKLGPVVTVRAGNVIGGGDYAADRIVPDCIRSLSEDKAITVRNPSAVRPWQHVLECLSGYLWLGARLGREGKNSPLTGGFNFGPGPGGRQTVEHLVDEVLRTWPGKWINISDPKSVHEARLLSLSIDKARALLSWYPVWDFEETVRQTVSWYEQRHKTKTGNLLDFTLQQIDQYVDAAKTKHLAWTD